MVAVLYFCTSTGTVATAFFLLVLKSCILGTFVVLDWLMHTERAQPRVAKCTQQTTPTITTNVLYHLPIII